MGIEGYDIGYDDGPRTGKLLWYNDGIEGWEGDGNWQWYKEFVWECWE